MATRNYKKLLTELYAKYNPDKLDQVDDLLEKYKGNEEALIRSVEQKYLSTQADKKEPIKETEKQPEPPAADKKEAPSAKKSGDAKESWEKRREEILRQVRERSENLKKEREVRAKPKAPETMKEEPVMPKREVPPVSEPQKEKLKAPEKEPVKEQVKREPPKEEKATRREPSQREERTKTSAKRDEPKKNLPARPAKARPVYYDDEETYSYKGLFIGTLIVLLCAIIVVAVDPGLRNSLMVGLGFNKSEQESNQYIAPVKKKKSIEPEMARSKEDQGADETGSAEESQQAINDDEFVLSEVDDEANMDNVADNTNPPQQNDPTLQKPFYIISYAAVSSKETAKKNVDELKRSGFKAGYFWIPDYQPTNVQLYKVYVGPFPSEQAAMQVIGEVTRMSPNAYVAYVQ